MPYQEKEKPLGYGGLVLQISKHKDYSGLFPIRCNVQLVILRFIVQRQENSNVIKYGRIAGSRSYPEIRSVRLFDW